VIALTLARILAMARAEGQRWQYHFPYFRDFTNRRVEWPGASQPPALSEPGVSVSAHRAPIIRP